MGSGHGTPASDGYLKVEERKAAASTATGRAKEAWMVTRKKARTRLQGRSRYYIFTGNLAAKEMCRT